MIRPVKPCTLMLYTCRQICRNSGYLATSSQAGPNIFHSSRQFLPRVTNKMSRNSYFSCFEVIYRNEFWLPVDFYFIKILSAAGFMVKRSVHQKIVLFKIWYLKNRICLQAVFVLKDSACRQFLHLNILPVGSLYT